MIVWEVRVSNEPAIRVSWDEGAYHVESMKDRFDALSEDLEEYVKGHSLVSVFTSLDPSEIEVHTFHRAIRKWELSQQMMLGSASAIRVKRRSGNLAADPISPGEESRPGEN